MRMLARVSLATREETELMKERRATHLDPPDHGRPVLARRREPLAVVAPLNAPYLVRVLLQDVRRVGREAGDAVRVGIDEEGEGLRGGRREGVVPLLMGLRLGEERREAVLREHDGRRDVACEGLSVRTKNPPRLEEQRERGGRTLKLDEQPLPRRSRRAVPHSARTQVFCAHAHDEAAGEKACVSARARRPSGERARDAPREEVQPVRVVVERRQLVAEDRQGRLGLARLERLEELLLSDRKLDGLRRGRMRSVSRARLGAGAVERRTVRSKEGSNGSSLKWCSTSAHCPSSTPWRKGPTAAGSSEKPDSACRACAV